jgi:hypothetical protein
LIILSKNPAILAIRNFKKRMANSRSVAFATVRERSPPFEVVRHRSLVVLNRSPMIKQKNFEKASQTQKFVYF